MTKNHLNERLEAFVQDHPDGWDHASWLELLSALQRDGIEVSDPEALGLSLERTRLAGTLKTKGVQGLGPKRIGAVVDRFGTLWALQHASADEIAEIPTIPSSLAKKVHLAVR